MPRKKLPRNAPCPCGSGKRYGDCCYGKDFEYLVDKDGTVVKSIPMSDQVVEVIEEQRRKFREQHGRDFGPGDKLFFDAPPVEHVEHYLVEAMKKAGINPGVIYAFEKTGFVVTEQNQHLLSEEDLAEWEAAIDEYEAQHGNEELPDDDENEWF